MSDRYTCPECGGRFKIPPSQHGQSILCPKCSSTITIGAASPGEDAAAPALEEASTVDRPASSSAGAARPPAAAAAARGPSEARAGEGPSRAAPKKTPEKVASSPEPSTAAAKVVSPDRDREVFSIRCQVCDTRIDVERAQIGRTIKCPDCFQSMRVAEPPPPPAKPKIAIDKAESVSLSAAVERRDIESRRQQRKSLAQKALEEAERELDRDKELYQEYDGVEWATWKAKLLPLKFMTQATIWPRWILASLGLAVALGSFQLAINMYFSGVKVLRVMAMLTWLFGFVWLALWSLSFAPKLMVIFEETARGRDRLDDWPSAGFLENLAEFAAFFASALFVGAPLAFFALFLVGIHLPLGLALLLSVAVLFLAHTFVFLSMCENNSIFKPFSPAVLQTIKLARPAWNQYALWAAALGFLTWIALLLLAFVGLYATIPSALVLVFVLLAYHRVLGQLAWGCADALQKQRQQDSS